MQLLSLKLLDSVDFGCYGSNEGAGGGHDLVEDVRLWFRSVQFGGELPLLVHSSQTDDIGAELNMRSEIEVISVHVQVFPKLSGGWKVIMMFRERKITDGTDEATAVEDGMARD